MNDAPPDATALGANVEKILSDAGMAKHERWGAAGFGVSVGQRDVQIHWSFGDFLEPSYATGTESPDHSLHPLLVFRRSVEATMLQAYAAVLFAAGFTITFHPDSEDEPAYLAVTRGPLKGVDPIQEIKDLHTHG